MRDLTKFRGNMVWTIVLYFFLYHVSGTARAADSQYDANFGKIWHDGNAEIGAYSLNITRYGSKRQGNAVAIFVTEPFSKSRRVKIDQINKDKSSDQVEVIKLNLIRDFPTGLYDYNTMLSVFVASENRHEISSGHALKVSYSSQEWCGHVYQQLLPRKDIIESQSHSYFESEGDENTAIPRPKDGILADSLFHWARGLSEPFLAAGSTASKPLLNSLSHMRLAHKPSAFSNATFQVDSATNELSAAGQQWTVRTHTVSSEAGHTYRFWVEASKPNRIIKWEFTGSEGVEETAQLVGIKRLPYWKLNGLESVKMLEEIGLQERNPLSP